MSRAVHLGELLSLGANSSASLRDWLQREDAALTARVEQEAASRGESLAQFVRIAVSDFLAEAAAENWTTLLSRIADAPDPGAVCVACVTDFRLRLEAAS